MGRLERHLDLDAVARVLNGIKPEPKRTLTKQKPPRPIFTYRGFWSRAQRDNAKWHREMARRYPLAMAAE